MMQCIDHVYFEGTNPQTQKNILRVPVLWWNQAPD